MASEMTSSNHTDVTEMAPKLASAHLMMTEMYDKTNGLGVTVRGSRLHGSRG